MELVLWETSGNYNTGDDLVMDRGVSSTASGLALATVIGVEAIVLFFTLRSKKIPGDAKIIANLIFVMFGTGVCFIGKTALKA